MKEAKPDSRREREGAGTFPKPTLERAQATLAGVSIASCGMPATEKRS